jgi:hypothetical protein
MKRVQFACAFVVAGAAASNTAPPHETGEDRMRYEDASGNTLAKVTERAAPIYFRELQK